MAQIKYNRKSIRLQEYDYSQAGFYFVTICCHDNKCLFGDIVEDKMILNEAGKMIAKWYAELENKFTDISCSDYIVMPNHFHCIIQNNGKRFVGADLCVCPNKIPNDKILLGEHIGLPLHSVIQWFKTMTTNEYIRGVKAKKWKSFYGYLWQRNYWEHIIRNEKSFNAIIEYIVNNPINWKDDKLFAK